MTRRPWKWAIAISEARIRSFLFEILENSTVTRITRLTSTKTIGYLITHENTKIGTIQSKQLNIININKHDSRAFYVTRSRNEVGIVRIVYKYRTSRAACFCSSVQGHRTMFAHVEKRHAAVSNYRAVSLISLCDVHLMGIKPLDSGLSYGEWRLDVGRATLGECHMRQISFLSWVTFVKKNSGAQK